MNLRTRGAAKRTAPALLTVLLASSLGLAACGGNEEANKPEPAAAPSPSASSTVTPSGFGMETAPEEADADLAMFMGSKMTLDPEIPWAGDGIGAKRYDEDPAERPYTVEDYKAGQKDAQTMGPNFASWQVMFNETANDAETSARNVSQFLGTNPDATLEDIRGQEGLLVNRYPNLGTAKVTQDKGTKFFVVVLEANDKNSGPQYLTGSLVEQPGITPEFEEYQK